MTIKKAICKTCVALGNVPVIGGLFKPKPKVAVIRLSGILSESNARRGSFSHKTTEKMIEDAFDTYDLKGVLMIINCPGGAPAQCSLIGDHIRSLADKKNVPVYAFVEDVAASGGYWLACAADEIYTNDTSIVGSIGVISASFGFQELIGKYGVERRVHTAGKQKSFLDPFMDEKPADVKRLKGIQSDMHEIFINWVKTRRADKLDGKDSELFEGQFWLAPKALKLGLIDGFGEARSFAKDKFGETIKFKEFGPDKKLLPSLLGTESKLPSGASLAEDAIDTIEAKSIWGRYGL
ncbi:MAG: S49 family peptidase [Alphaproteobacteria bacterium]|nr:S49 family peptidase [Alphaproteobacteria bacterium]